MKEKIRVFKGRELADDIVEHTSMFAIAAASGLSTYYAFGTTGVLVAGALSGIFAVASKKIDFAALFHKADKHVRDLSEDHPVSQAVARHAERQYLPSMPRVCELRIDPSSDKYGMPIAGALGTRESSMVIVSPDLADDLTPSELDAVIAHEVEHIHEEDTKAKLLASSMGVGAYLSWKISLAQLCLSLLPFIESPAAYTLFSAYVANLSVKLLRSRISQAAERRADRGAVETSHNPWALSSALSRLHEISGVSLKNVAHRRIDVEDLLSRTQRVLFGSHPLTQSRQKRMVELANEMYRKYPEKAVAFDAIRARTLRESEEKDREYVRESALYESIEKVLDRMTKGRFSRLVSRFTRASVPPIHEYQNTDDLKYVRDPAYQTPLDDIMSDDNDDASSGRFPVTANIETVSSRKPVAEPVAGLP